MRSRVIVGNLDCEHAYAGSARGLPGPVAERASALATLLRVFAADGDRLWTMRPVDADRAPPVVELPRVGLESGPLAAADQLLAWGETEEVCRLRLPGPAPNAGAAPLHERLWQLPAPAPSVAARCNHRGFAFALSRALGCALPGARIIRSRGELDAHLAAGGARAGHGGWVLKAPFGAAGRERLLRRGRDLSPDVCVRVDRLLDAHGQLLFEPWVERTADYGICGLALPNESELYPPHRLRCDRQGVIRAVEIDDREAAPAPVRAALEAAGRAAAEALAREGYRGPFNVDAFTYVDEAGAPRIQPLCEINARLSFGFVARALGERVAAARGMDPGRLELCLDTAAPAGGHAVSLLHPDGRDGAGAALVMHRPRRAQA